jgi:predicted alpha/beta-hydrolase family hydrolase
VTASVGLLLAPGASADRNQSALVAIDEAATGAGFVVVRMDFPYKKAGKRAPDRAPVLVQAVVDEATQLSTQVDAVVLGGRSMGGRMCSVAVAEGTPAAGLVLISYPLHAPGRPEQLRTEHFPDVSVPCLFVSGTRDAFGSPAELEAAAEAIRGRVTFHWIEGKSHGLRGADPHVAGVVVQWLEGLTVPSRRPRRSRRQA